MSWLNFNESLNSIKGQLSSFASSVLADGIVGETENDVAPTKSKIEDLEESQKIRSAELQTVTRAYSPENGNSWSWEPPGEPPGGPPSSLVPDLRKKIEMLESEKKELVLSLEQLDLDCQQTTDKLVTLKDSLQTSYNELKVDFEKLQREYGDILIENMSKSKEIEILRAGNSRKPLEESVKRLQEENDILRTKLVISQKEMDTHHEFVQKYKELGSICENNSVFLEEESDKNKEQNELCARLKNDNKKLRTKLEEYEKMNESVALKDNIARLQEEDDEVSKIANEKKKLQDENQKLKIAIEYLQSNVEELKNDKEVFRIECEKLNNEDLQRVKTENEKLIQANENLKATSEEFKIELERSQSANEELQKAREYIENERKDLNDQLEQSRNHIGELKKKLGELHGNNTNLSAEHENLKSFAEKLKMDYEKLHINNKELTRQLQNEDRLRATQNLLDQETLAKEKEALHEKYLSIITENMKKYIDLNTENTSNISSFLPDEPQTLEFAGKVETLLKLLLDFKCKTEALEKELCEVTQEKNKVVAEKNFEIEKLLKNSEILSQEVISKTQAIKDYEDECGELMKNNDLLISELQNYKNSSGLQTISESNEDNMLLLETQLENANKKIQDMELIISDLENSKQEANLETQTELEYIKKQLNLTGQELSHSKEEYQELKLRHKQLADEKQSLKAVLDKIRAEYENTEYKYTEVNVSMETLKEENDEYKNRALDLENGRKKLETVNFNLENKIELLQNVVDDLKQKLDAEMENTSQKELHIRNLVERLQNSKMCETGLKLQVDTIYKELQTVSEAKQTLGAKYNQSQTKLQELQDELVKAKEEFSQIQGNTKDGEELPGLNDSEDAKQDIVLLNSDTKLQESNQNGCLALELQNQQQKARQEKGPVEADCTLQSNLGQVLQQNQDLQQKVSILETELVQITTSRNEIVALVTAKHQENVQYHGEIQRLNHLLAAETEKAHLLEIQLHNLNVFRSEAPSAEELLRNSREMTRKDEDIEKLTDQNKFLRDKCEVLAQNLLQEQSNVQKVLSERLSVSDKEQSLAKELERLRAHLVEIEEMYTQELLQAEQKNQEMQAKVNEIERREKDSSSIYTSVSIRANQQVETLQTQLQLVTNQRDELRVKVSDFEDAHNKQVAALTNLQLVLEQFQKERDKDVHQETERVRRQITVERQIQQELRGEIASLKLQLQESKQGLQAASRLMDQLEKCNKQIVIYKDEVTKLQEQVKNRETKYKELSNQTDGKVDKTLIKNLIIGYITSHSNDQNQILKIIATVLDFNQTESNKVHLNSPQHDGGWLSSILHPQSLNSGADMTRQSLSEAFVRFLENESKPKVLPNLLVSNQTKTAEGSGSTTPQQSPSPHVLSEVVLPTFVDFGKSRNSSSILKDVLKDNS